MPLTHKHDPEHEKTNTHTDSRHADDSAVAPAGLTTYERDRKVPNSVGNQYPSIEPVNPPEQSYSGAPLSGATSSQYPNTSSGAFATPYDQTSSSQHMGGTQNFNVAPGSTYGTGPVAGSSIVHDQSVHTQPLPGTTATSMIHDEHVRDRTIPGQGIVYDDKKKHEETGSNRHDAAFVAAPLAGQSTTVCPRVEGLAADKNGRYDGFDNTPDGINSRIPKEGVAATAAHEANKHHDKHRHDKDHDNNNNTTTTGTHDNTTGEHSEGHKKGKIGQMISNLTHKDHSATSSSTTSADKDPMQMYQDSVRQAPDTSAPVSSSTYPASTGNNTTQSSTYHPQSQF